MAEQVDLMLLDGAKPLRHPASSVVTGLPSAAMNRAVPGSDSIAVFGATSGRSLRRSVSMMGPFSWASVTPALSGGNIGFHPHNSLRKRGSAYSRHCEE